MITLTKGTLSLQLRNPDFGDRESIEVRRINRKTRGGDLVMYRDPAWPKYATYTYSFSYLSQDDLYKLIEFMKSTLGQEITITDYEGRVLSNCIITTPTEELTQDGVEDFRASFSFQVPL